MKVPVKKLVVSILVGLAISFLLFYVFLPPLNIHAKGFWFYLFVCMLAFFAPWLFGKNGDAFFVLEEQKQTLGKSYKVRLNKSNKVKNVLAILLLVPFAVLILFGIGSSTFLRARSYADIVKVEEAVFAEDMPESTTVTNIALMDTESATILGNRTLGSLSDVVSQYNVSDTYMQINYQNKPRKVANLEYDGFFKWIGNRAKGIPGMVMVDPVGSSAAYVKFPEPMKYAESGWFNDDLMRKLRFSYPGKIFESVSFEIDEAGHPYYIVACAKPRVGLFGAVDINEVIIFDPCTGESSICALDETPSWVDIVYTGNLACAKYNWYGTLSGGFLNSVFGQKDCKQTTDDFGYLVLEDDVWYFTGVTSVSGDRSNIGFILTNARTGAYKFYPVIGAEEHSAMAAAEGEVQEKNYIASFPSLVNISGQATYIMVLKDAAGLVKLYALVNVENYSIVATGTTQTEAMSAYKKQLGQSGIDIGGGGESKSADITVENIRIAMVANVSTVYITATDGVVYKGYLEADESLILIRTGDALRIEYADGENEKIKVVTSWSFAD